MRLLQEARLADADLQPYVNGTGSQAYQRVLIHRTPEVEILALTWNRNGATPIHDHAGQRCWMVAHSGVFIVDDYRQIAGERAPGHAVVERIGTTPNVTVGMPDFRYERGRDIHRVRLDESCRHAVSIHVYARPYTSCLVFDEAERRARELPLVAFSPF